MEDIALNLHRAVRRDNVAHVHELLGRPGTNPQWKLQAWEWALTHGSKGCVDALLEDAPHPKRLLEHPTGQLETALLLATRCGHTQIAITLIHEKANVLATDKVGGG